MLITGIQACYTEDLGYYKTRISGHLAKLMGYNIITECFADVTGQRRCLGNKCPSSSDAHLQKYYDPGSVSPRYFLASLHGWFQSLIN